MTRIGIGEFWIASLNPIYKHAEGGDYMDREEGLKLDYEQTIKYVHTLADIRFKLLTLVPVATGAAMGLLKGSTQPSSVISIGILGFMVTLGIVFYDQRNTQIYNVMVFRAKALELLLGFEYLGDKERTYGGPFLDRPKRRLKFFHLVLMWHDRGLAVIYSAALGGWSYLITNGILTAAKVQSSAWSIALSVGVPVVVAVVILLELHRFDEPTDELDILRKRIPQLYRERMEIHRKQNVDEEGKNL